MNPEAAPTLTESEHKNLAYLRANHQRPDFAAARRQQWHKLLGYLDKLAEKIRALTYEVAQHRFHAGGLYLAATGQLTEDMIAASTMLSEAQKAQCRELRALFLRQPQPQPAHEPAPQLPHDSTNQA